MTIPAAFTGMVVEDGAAAGTAAGAVYVPVVLSTEPQSLLPPLQLALLVLAVVSKVTPQVSCLGSITLPLKSLARNSCVAPVARVAVAGLSVMRIPESKPMLNLPVFFLSALEVAVMVTSTLGNLV